MVTKQCSRGSKKKKKKKEKERNAYLIYFRIEFFKNSTKNQVDKILYCNWFRSKFMILSSILLVSV